MADASPNSNLLPVYNYRVTIIHDGDTSVLGFSEISGLSVQYESVTYKHGMSFLMGSMIIRGMRLPIRLTLKRGVAKDRAFLAEWFKNANSEPFYSSAMRDIVIDLCDETGEAVIRWTAQRSLPTKLDAPGFVINSNEIAIESLEVVAHGLEIEYNP